MRAVNAWLIPEIRASTVLGRPIGIAGGTIRQQRGVSAYTISKPSSSSSHISLLRCILLSFRASSPQWHNRVASAVLRIEYTVVMSSIANVSSTTHTTITQPLHHYQFRYGRPDSNEGFINTRTTVTRPKAEFQLQGLQTGSGGVYLRRVCVFKSLEARLECFQVCGLHALAVALVKRRYD